MPNDTERDKALRVAYGKATSRVRDAHRDEFNRYYQEEALVVGYDWQPKLTPEERAAQEVTRLLAEFPDIRERVLA